MSDTQEPYRPNARQRTPINVEEGKHYDIEDMDDLPYRHSTGLGQGGSATVDLVVHTTTGVCYARKIIYIYGGDVRRRRREMFQNEIDVVQSLKGHPHIIRLITTFATADRVGLILQPVADGRDLARFLDSFREDKALSSGNVRDLPGYTILRKAFGCLASGLAFIQSKRIRHKDIKPQNILIHKGLVIYTDFGFALDSSNRSNSMTQENRGRMTRRYSAPEVIEHEPRNSKSDVYSLGCVYLVILSALTGMFDLPDDATPFFEDMGRLHCQLDPESMDPSISFLVNICKNMTSQSPLQRNSAQQVLSEFQQHQGFTCAQCHEASTPESSPSLSRSETVKPADISMQKRMDTLKVVDHEIPWNENAGAESPGALPPKQLSWPWIWSDQHNDYYWVSYDNNKPIYHWHRNADSSRGANAHDHLSPGTHSNTGFAEVNRQSPPFHIKEKADPGLRKREGTERREFFTRGRVFTTYWIPSAGKPDTKGTGNASDIISVAYDRYGEPSNSAIRRFVIVEVEDTRVKACAISTYDGKGTTVSGCVPAEHAIIYLKGTEPLPFKGEIENGMDKEPIEVDPAESKVPLPPASRIRFSKTYSIEKSAEVKDIGQVIPEHVERLMEYWGEEQGELEL